MKVAIICNTNAAKVKKGISERVKAILKHHAIVVAETSNSEELEGIVSRYIDEADVWCFIGGDGTLNRGLNILWQKTGMKDEIPIPVLHGKAGSLNAIPMKVPLKGDLDDILIRFYDLISQLGNSGRIPRDNIRKFGTIRIDPDKPNHSMLCFTFFLGVPFLISKEVIQQKLDSHRSIMQFVYSTIAKFVVGRDSHKFIRKIKAEIEIEGKKYLYQQHYVIVGSVFREPALFFRPFLEPEKYKNGFYFLVYSGDAWTALRNFRIYARGIKTPPHSFSDIASEVKISATSGMNFDGELIDSSHLKFRATVGPTVNLIRV